MLLVGVFSSFWQADRRAQTPRPAQATRRIIAGIVATAALACAMPSPAGAQGVNCDRVSADIARLQRGDGGKAANFSRAAQKQQGEIDRTLAYANSIGCSNRKFLFFGSNPPPQCAAIDAQVQKMRYNMQNLLTQAEMSGGGNETQLSNLTFLYNSQCRQAPGNARITPDYQELPLDAPPSRDPMADGFGEPAQRGGSKALCVRTCDGSFFPVSYSARGGNMEELADQCRALCPNAEVKLYTTRGRGEIEDAVSPDGESYTDLPNAFKFQKKVDSTCSCRRPGQSWLEALEEAERVLGQSGRNDIVVTPQKADELARPSTNAKAKPPATRKNPNAAIAAQGAAGALPDQPIAPADGPVIATDVPLVSTIGEPELREVTGKDGIKRRVRIVGPAR